MSCGAQSVASNLFLFLSVWTRGQACSLWYRHGSLARASRHLRGEVRPARQELGLRLLLLCPAHCRTLLLHHKRKGNGWNVVEYCLKQSFSSWQLLFIIPYFFIISYYSLKMLLFYSWTEITGTPTCWRLTILKKESSVGSSKNQHHLIILSIVYTYLYFIVQNKTYKSK